VVQKGKSENDLAARASLLRRDSVHGAFRGTIRVLEDQNKLVCNGNEIQVIYSDSPDSMDYTQYGIKDALVVDNTGAWRDREGLGQHLRCPGVSRVLLTAPGKGDIPNVVFGVNHDTIAPEERIVSAASCTTNAIVPVLKVLLDEYALSSSHRAALATAAADRLHDLRRGHIERLRGFPPRVGHRLQGHHHQRRHGRRLLRVRQ
jgi:glyceraldehyde 3-phosphate dehydrogenase